VVLNSAGSHVPSDVVLYNPYVTYGAHGKSTRSGSRPVDHALSLLEGADEFLAIKHCLSVKMSNPKKSSGAEKHTSSAILYTSECGPLYIIALANIK
jgi:hypothetical protein